MQITNKVENFFEIAIKIYIINTTRLFEIIYKIIFHQVCIKMHNSKQLKQFKKLEWCYYVVYYLLVIIETGEVQSVGVFLREPKTYLGKDIQD